MNLLNDTNHLDIYLNLDCNLRCKHCFVGVELEKRINFEKHSLFNLLTFAKEKGVNKVSLLGGEPTMYPYLLEVLELTEFLKFRETRIVTNGTKPLTRLINAYAKSSSKPTLIFSLDSVSESTHDLIRGRNTYKQLINNIRLANEYEFKVAGITSISTFNQSEIINILDFAESCKMQYLNFHLVNRRGFANDELVLSADEWLDIRKVIIEYSVRLNYPVRFDRKFISLTDLNTMNPYYDECFVNQEKGGNIMVLPDGRVYKCALFIDGNNLNSHFWNGSEMKVNPAANTEKRICSGKCSGECPGYKEFSSGSFDNLKFATTCMYRKEVIRKGKVYLIELSTDEALYVA